MATLHAQLISPDRVVFDGEIRSVVIPGVEGDMTVFPGHQPVVTMLLPGMIVAVDAAGAGRRAFVRGGYVEITGTSVTILADEAFTVEEVTPDMLDDEILRFNTLRDGSTDDMKRSQYSASISRLQELKASLALKS